MGSNTWQPIAARLVLATHRPLEVDCEEGRFRRDLFERLRGFTIVLPPLRERRADLPLLVQHFVDEYNADYPGKRSVPSGVVDTLFRYAWPGNVRELRLAVRQAAAYSGGERAPISALHLLEVVQRRARDDAAPQTLRFDPRSESWREVHDRLRTRYFHAILAEAGGNKKEAAKLAGLSTAHHKYDDV